jgi:hypothetical protein
LAGLLKAKAAEAPSKTPKMLAGFILDAPARDQVLMSVPPNFCNGSHAVFEHFYLLEQHIIILKEDIH